MLKKHAHFAVFLCLAACQPGDPGDPDPTSPGLGRTEQALGVCGEPLCFSAADTLLNTTVAGAQETPAVATALNGATVVVYRDRSGLVADATNGDSIRARFFNAQGLALGDDVLVETATTRTQQTPSVAAGVDGTFLVVWADNRMVASDPAGYSIRGRRYSSAGGALDAADFQINVTTTLDQTTPVVAAAPGGGFLIAWKDGSRRAPDVSSGAIRARRIRPDGTLAPAEIDVNSTTANDQSEPAIAVAADGTWAVAFTDASVLGGDASGTQVRLRRFGANDAALAADVRVSERTDRDQRQPDLAYAPDGTLVVVFTDYGGAGDPLEYELRARRVAANGTLLGEAFVATTQARTQTNPVVTALADEGRFLIAFTDDSRLAPDISSTGVRGRLLGFDGVFDGADQVLATATYGAQAAPALPANARGGVLTVWADSGNVAPDVAAPAIRGRWLRLARCGDGRVDAERDELCDDGNTAPGDGCSVECQPELCGDGVVQAGESCDHGEANALAGPCLPDCTAARCGDGIDQVAEGCDDGNLVAGDGCSAACVREPPSREACEVYCAPTASFDACNGNDDDCDGAIDEDAALGFDPAHCGACNQGPCPSAAPYQARLRAPAGSAMWEPSAAAVIGDRLWVGNDKDGVLAAYTLPLSIGANTPVQSFSVRPNGVTPKWEAMRAEAAGTFLLLNATGSTVWRCDPGVSCAGPVSVGVAPSVTALGAGTRLESLVPTPTHLFLGSRAAPSKMADEAGVTANFGNLSPDGRSHQMSDAVYYNGRFYMTWTYEGAGTTLSDVGGLLAVTVADAAGRPDASRLRICQTLAGKPEGLNRWGDKLVVVFDQDDARKAKGAADPSRFTLAANEDFATVIPLGVCD